MTTQQFIKRSEEVPLIEVFTTNIQSTSEAEHILKILENSFPKLRINFDLNETELPYPCGHTILRIEGNTINAEHIILIMQTSGFMCDILEDKVCS